MPAPNTSYYGVSQQKPSCYNRVSNSVMMGTTIGVTIGVVYGGIATLRSGFRGRELISKIGKTMIQSGATFGTFMGVGAALRC